MMNHTLPLVALCMLFFLVILTPAYAQISDHVVINEVDTNPPGSDASTIIEWVELYNPTDSDVDISGWKVASTTVLKKTLAIPFGTIIEPDQFLIYSYQSIWFADINDSVELLDKNNLLVDKTPSISDTENDSTSWQRLYDGHDSDGDDDWKFVTSTIGSSNGKLIQPQIADKVTVSVSTSKSSYLFGDVATIQGSVSEEIRTVKPYFTPAQILVTISGPNFDRTIPLYPDRNQSYSTTLNLHKVLGIDEGTYDVTVSYGDEAIAKTNFSVGFKVTQQQTKKDGSISIATDKLLYIPGETVSITGFTTDIIPLEGMKFTITDSEENLITNGNLFPTNGKFITSIFIDNTDPSYGTYTILAKYFDQSTSASFDVVEDVKENVPISLWTDKIAYSVGDPVKITGRLNDVWVGTLNVEILQTTQITGALGKSDTGFKILDGLKVLGDGSFSYNFVIPDNENRLGDYKIRISQDIGSVDIVIHAVTNPADFVVSDDPLTLFSDKETYVVGQKMLLNGFIKDPFVNSSYKTGEVVNIDISHKDGRPLEIVALSAKHNSNDGESIEYDFTAIPETSGNYMIEIDLYQSIFTEGEYVIESKYLKHTVKKNITITSNNIDFSDGPIITLDKQVYGLGETIHLTGIIPPTAVQGIQISITKPDGTITTSGTTVNDQRFSWSWVTPTAETFQYSNPDSAHRSVVKSNFGIYKLTVSMDSLKQNILFKVSANPANDSISTIPLSVSTEKSLYKAGEKLKVTGNVVEREQGDEGLQVHPRVNIRVLDGTFPFKQIDESTVYPAVGGSFSAVFELPTTIFSQGPYTVKATYLHHTETVSFSVANDFIRGLEDDDIFLLASTDKTEYYPGDVVLINGKPNKLIYLENFDVSVGKISDSEFTCGLSVCGPHVGPIITIQPNASGSFTHQFAIPDMPSAAGTYKVAVDANFEQKIIEFTVLGRELPAPPKSDTIIEKVNRIADRTVIITTEEKSVDGTTVAPRVLSGSLITPNRGDESTVNLKVSTASGICIIGPVDDSDCLVSESTRKQGQIYDVIQIDGVSFNVRYSGSDVRLEKFSILPESPTAFLPDANWNIDILKDDEVSRFYYKIAYKTIVQ